MPDKITEAFSAVKSTGLFLDEKDFRDQLNKSPKDVFSAIGSTGLFIDYNDFENSLGLKKKEPSVPSVPASGQPSSVPSPSPSQLPSVFQDLSKGINLRNVSDSPSPTAAIQTRIKANEMAQGGKPTMTVAEKHQKEVEAARKKVDQAIQNSDPILTRMIREGRVFDFEREISKTPTLDGFINPAINTARKDIILNSPVKPEEIATKKQEALQNDATAREVLRRSAKNNKDVAKSAYLLDAEQRAAENPLKVNDIIQNADKIAAGELRYNIKSGILEKPENPFESIIRGFKERSQQLNDYEAFTTGSDQDVIAKLEKERASYDPDKPVPVADGGTSQFTQMLGMEGVPMVKSSAAAVLTNAIPGGQAAAPYVAAFVSSPEYYKRSYSSALRDAYFELRNKGVSEDEALATAKKQAESEGVLGAAEGVVSSAIGARVGLKPTPIVRSSGVKSTLENIVRAGGNFIKENAPEGLTDAAVAGALQIAKNVEARDNGLDRDILDGVDDNVVGELMFTFGMGAIVHGGKAVVNDKTYKTIVSALARQPKEAVDAKIGEMVVTGKATPKRAAEIGKEIDEVRAVDSKIPDEVEDVAVRTEIVDKIKQRDELKVKLAKVDEAFHPEIRQEIAKVEDEIKEMSKAPVIEQPAETVVQPEPVKPIADRARSFILGEDETTSNVADALKSTGIRITELPAAEFEARVKEVGGQGSEEGVFVADNGEIILNKDTASNITKIHEGAHPVMNIIYNTNRSLYDQAVTGMQMAAAKNKGIQGAIEFGQQYEGEATQNDEALVETIARIGTGDIDINTIDTGFKQTLIDFVNRIAKVFGFEQVLNDTDVAAFKRLAARVAESLREGKDISGIVGKENVGRFEVNLGVQSRLRDGEPAVGVDSDKVARERFDIPNLKRLGGGSDRDVFDLGDGNVLKIAKTARGLAQNGAENDWYLSSNGLLPEVVEAGANYIVSKKAEKPTGNKELNKMLAELGKFSQRDFDNKTGELQDALAKYGLEDVLSYDLIWRDFTAKRNWGVIDGKPIHVDGGTYAGVSMLDDYKGVKNLEDSEFRDVYYRSKSAKKQFGDKDKFGQFSKSRIGSNVDIINGFYSPIENRISEFKQPKASVQKWKEIVGIKSDEAVFSGLADWLGSMKPDRQLSKDEVLKFIKDNRIQISEIEKGQFDNRISDIEAKVESLKEERDMLFEDGVDNSDRIEEIRNEIRKLNEEKGKLDRSVNQTKYSNYQLPGGENYKEVLITIPSRSNYGIDKWDFYRSKGYTPEQFDALPIGKKRELFDEFKMEDDKAISKSVPDFRSTHFDEPNIITHLRMNTRTDADGKKVLFLEEVQSDWGQEGKRKGFGENKPNDYNKLAEELKDSYDVTAADIKEDVLLVKQGMNAQRIRAKERLINYFGEERALQIIENQGQSKVPSAPYVTNTNAWVKLGLKVALKEAVKQGADRIAWTTGEQQNERYDLSKQVNRIDIEGVQSNLHFVDIELSSGGTENLEVEDGIIRDGSYKGQRLEDVIGKEYAEKVLSTPVNTNVILKGDDLKLGGKGMKAFYGDANNIGIVGNVAKALVKELTGVSANITESKVLKQPIEEVVILEEDVKSFKESGWNVVKIEDNLYDATRPINVVVPSQPAIDITPELRDAVQGGIPQFSKSRLTLEESAIIDQSKANGTYMKAPNGKPTKLNEKQWAQVRTQNFKNWFGDWENDPANASKVVDENGEPMVVYHGGPKFEKFRNGEVDKGIYFTDNKYFAQDVFATQVELTERDKRQDYNDVPDDVLESGEWDEKYFKYAKVYNVFLNIRNPKVVEAIDAKAIPYNYDESKDGFIAKSTGDFGYAGGQYVVFNPNQIKSATDNTGEFNPADNRIQASKSRLEKDKNFKIAAFVMKEKAEGTPDQEIFDGIKSVMPNMSDAEIMSAVSDPEGFIRTKFSNLSSAVQQNLISRARVTKTTAPIPQVEAGDQDVILTVRPEDVQAALTEESIMDDFINDAKAVKNKYFDAAQGLPNWIMGIKDITSGVRDLEIRKAVDLSKELKKVAANIGFKDWDTFTKAMKSLTPEAVQVSNSTGIQPWYANIAAQNKFMSMPPAVIPAEVAALPEEIRPYVFAMRGMVDGLTKDLIGAGFVTPEQAQKLESNIGSYLNRAYRLFNEYKYKPSKKDKEEAVTYLANGIINQLKNQYKGSKSYQEISEEAVELANKEVEIILKKNLNPYFKKGEKRDVSILKERKDIPEPIRKLMGEYTDPVTIFVMTVAKQAALRGASQYLTALRNNGIGTMFFEKNDPRRPANFTHEIAGEGSETMSPLNGLYTTPEIAEALEGINPAVNELVSLWTKFVGAVRWGKTVGSVTTQVKNFLSNIGFAVMNGLIYTGKNGKAISSAGKYWSGQITGRKLDDLTQKVMALGLVDQSIGASEIKRLLGTGDMHDIAIELAVTGKAKGMANWIGKPFKALNKAYQLSDDFWKVYAYMNERELVSKAMFGEEYDNLTPEQQVDVDMESSERVKNTWPTYSRVWKGAKYVSENLPIFGNFVSFQAESVRVLGNTFKLAMADIKSGDPAFAAIGYKRLAGMITYVSLRSALTYAAAHAAGIGAAGLMGLFDDDEEKNREEGLRNALPPFMRTGDLLAIPAGDGKYTVYDLSSLDPYGIVFKSLNALTEGREGVVGDKMEPGVAAAMAEFLSGFFEQEMTFKTSMNVANNNNEKTGGQIYTEDMTPSQGWMEVGKYFWNQLKPSTVGMAERLTGDNKIAEVSAVVGARPYEVDLYRSFGRVMSSNSKNFSDIIKEYNAVKYDPKSTQAQKDEAEKKAEERIAYYADKMSRVYRQFLSLGADPKKLNEMIANKSQVKSTGWSKGLKRSIKTGEITPDKYLK